MASLGYSRAVICRPGVLLVPGGRGERRIPEKVAVYVDSSLRRRRPSLSLSFASLPRCRLTLPLPLLPSPLSLSHTVIDIVSHAVSQRARPSGPLLRLVLLDLDGHPRPRPRQRLRLDGTSRQAGDARRSPCVGPRQQRGAQARRVGGLICSSSPFSLLLVDGAPPCAARLFPSCSVCNLISSTSAATSCAVRASAARRVPWRRRAEGLSGGGAKQTPKGQGRRGRDRRRRSVRRTCRPAGKARAPRPAQLSPHGSRFAGCSYTSLLSARSSMESAGESESAKQGRCDRAGFEICAVLGEGDESWLAPSCSSAHARRARRSASLPAVPGLGR